MKEGYIKGNNYLFLVFSLFFGFLFKKNLNKTERKLMKLYKLF